MKYLILICFLSISIGCNRDVNTSSQFESQGQILGLDDALCVCCGNWVIEIEGESYPYQFLELPTHSGIDLNNVEFPLSVRLNWTQSTTGCKFVLISEIEIN